MAQEEDASLEWSLFGLTAMGWLPLLHQIVTFFFAGPHRWRQHASKKLSRLLRLLVARFLFDYQRAIIEHELSKITTEGSYHDYVIVRHMWDETQQLILRPFEEDDPSDTPGDLFESVTTPTLLQIGGFTTSLMSGYECVCVCVCVCVFRS